MVIDAPDESVSGADFNMKSLVFHADDLGLAYGFNEAIRDAHLHGLVTSTCLQAVGHAYEHAVSEVLPDCPDLGVGIHLNLVECRPRLAARRVPDLVDAHGCFRGYAPLLAATWSRRIRSQIQDECRAQIERPLADGVSLDHVNSHRHAHMLPGLFDLVCELAAGYGIPFVRMTRERFHLPRHLKTGDYLLRDANVVKQGLMNLLAARNRPRLSRHGLRSNSGFVGISYTGYGSQAAAENALAAHAEEPLVELLLHVCRGHDPRDTDIPISSIRAYCNHPQRRIEIQTAGSASLGQVIARMGFERTHYRRLAAPRGPVGNARADGHRSMCSEGAPCRS